MANLSDRLKLAPALQARADELGWSITRLANEADAGYENIRQILRGKSFPSKLLLKQLAGTLELELAHLSQLLVHDKLVSKYGDIPSQVAGKKEGLLPIENCWDQLTKDQQTTLADLARTWASKNRKKSKTQHR